MYSAETIAFSNKKIIIISVTGISVFKLISRIVRYGIIRYNLALPKLSIA